MPEDAGPGPGSDILKLRKELRALEERRSEEALKLFGEVSDRRQVGCFWLVMAVLMLISAGVAWLHRYPQGTSSMVVHILAALAALSIIISFLRLHQARRADDVAEEKVSGYDRRASQLREKMENLGAGPPPRE